MKLALGVVVVLLSGCPRDRTTAGGGTASGSSPTVVATDAAAAPVDAPIPPMPAYHPAAVTIESLDVAPAQLDWNRRLLTQDDLEQALDDVAAARRLGTFVVLVPGGRLERYDAKAHTLPYSGPGLRGLQVDPPVSFAASPSITRGEMPLGGHVSLDVGRLQGTIAIDAKEAQALVDGLADDPLAEQFLIELDGVGEVDGARIVRATLHGVRVVRQRAREVYLEGTSTGLGR